MIINGLLMILLLDSCILSKLLSFSKKIRFTRMSENDTHKIIIKTKLEGLDEMLIKFVQLCCPPLIPVLTQIVNVWLENSVKTYSKEGKLQISDLTALQKKY